MATRKIDGLLAKADTWLFSVETSVDLKAHRTLWHTSRVLFAAIRDLFSGNITLHAMGLVYTTILSIVPFLALSFSVLKGFGVHNQLEPLLNTLTEPLGSQGPELVANIVGFVDNFKVGVLGSVGLGLLIYTVISLVQKVENSFNQIWRVSQPRTIGQRFSNYLSVIIIGPVLVFSALGATGTLMNSAIMTYLLEIGPLGWLFATFSRMTPYFMIIGLFTFLYTFIPNTKVKIRYAFIGGITGGILWQTVGFAFAKFFAVSASQGSYAAIYSGFAIGIVSLWWLYLCWLILLFGASVAFYAQHAMQITRSRVNNPSAEIDEHTGLSMMYRVAKQFDGDGGGLSISEMESNLSVGPEAINRIYQKLVDNGFLIQGGDGGDKLFPAKALDHILICDLLKALRQSDNPLPASLKQDHNVLQLTQKIEQSYQQIFDDLTLAQWVRQTAQQAPSNTDVDLPKALDAGEKKATAS
ncbi:YihY/virulence factor BrkB family protein [Aurantivibrio plasticivorans]